MSSKLRKLQKKISPPPAKAATPKPKVGNDYFLLAVIAFTAIVPILGWNQIDSVNILLYFVLLISLCITYARRHKEFHPATDELLEKIGMGATVAAIVLFLIVCYNTWFR